jgi:2-polyprenyl-6-methoxyphenol hydroxylase-like FAD-dependent oxidoreductase
LPAGIRTPDGHWLTRTSASATTDLRVVHRGDLHAILMAAVPTVRFDAVGEVHTSAGGAAVVLESGRRHDFDLVVGADGIGSRIRSTLFEDPGIRYAGYTAWRGVTAGPVMVTDAGETWGRGERFGIAPMGDGRVYWFAVAGAPAGGSAPDESVEVARRFASWHAPIADLLHATDPRSILRNDILELDRPAANFVIGRVVLIGDAAHAMTPNLGQGGNQAIEDGIALAVLLEGRDPVEMPAILPQYEKMRRVRTDVIQAEARKNGLRFDSKYEDLEQRDREVANSAAFRRWLFDYVRTLPLARARIVKIRQLIADCCDATSRLATLSAVSAPCRCPTSANPNLFPQSHPPR